MILKTSWNLFDKNGDTIAPDKFEVQESITDFSFDFSLKFQFQTEVSKVFLDIVFQNPIKAWRKFDYSWKKPNDSFLLSNIHSPKILKAHNDLKVVAISTLGCWEYISKGNILRWHFFNPMLSPSLIFDQNDKRHFLQFQAIKAGTKINSGLIWGKGLVEEWARTPHGFIPTLCFTDHSDFDTLKNLQVQRRFFKDIGLRTTKGFFLYDYTHKPENASFEDQESRDELILWEQDGHELAYHALSQSYRGEISEMEFDNFVSPKEIQQVETYIDHGFHPYNYTKQKLGNWEKWYQHMGAKGIQRIWTYVDAGEANYFNLNQINPKNFTWQKMRESSNLARKKGLNRKRLTDLRNFLMYGVSESVLREGKSLGGSFSALKSNPSLSGFSRFTRLGLKFIYESLQPNSIRELLKKSKQVFPVSTFGPLFFDSPNQQSTSIQSFQTLAIRDFDIAFSELALDALKDESGVVIAHTYFAYTGQNHEGRLFEDESWNLRVEAKKGFERVGKMVKEGKLWNPTLREMHSFYKHLEEIEYEKVGEDLRIKNFKGVSRQID
ncbi:hypothetical protein DFQ04_1438 [Algoriphagus boseongensis]|uniref:Uncharacterized protein n=1 Tax=Algoriphagus boseongensis TaxID=1442587 RepID=A0A4R6TDV8_9BACT|nr:hypothetical protein [Algoriphagus boseongensis]TDQ19614.1 hypothetical protein DFQ04_1438 [Algoriphagus boseongensis]